MTEVTEFVTLLALLLGSGMVGAAIIVPYVSDVPSLYFLPLLTSTIGLAISVVLIVDTIFVFQRISHTHLIDTLLGEERHKLPEKDLDEREKQEEGVLDRIG